MNGFGRSVRWSEELSFRANHRYIINRKTDNSVCLVPWQLWTIIWNCHFYIKIYIVILPLRVKQNSFILLFELEVGKFFYVSRSLFPDIGYSNL